mmetsp:Transcript_21518/g.54213  ORF Transcript_21518/g.54213 Transcript_21518/m.54213 type:complete len:236 (+) Transcript_21518:901-1608(+)
MFLLEVDGAEPEEEDADADTLGFISCSVSRPSCLGADEEVEELELFTVSRMFSGLRSRCSTPCLWMYSTPATSCLNKNKLNSSPHAGPSESLSSDFCCCTCAVELCSTADEEPGEEVEGVAPATPPPPASSAAGKSCCFGSFCSSRATDDPGSQSDMRIIRRTSEAANSWLSGIERGVRVGDGAEDFSNSTLLPLLLARSELWPPRRLDVSRLAAPAALGLPGSGSTTTWERNGG